MAVVLLCLCWYCCSTLTNGLSKEIIVHFNYPLILTTIQFLFVIAFTAVYNFRSICYPSVLILQMTLPLGICQIVGHYLSSAALSTISVSTSHTIKALSPIFTVLFYSIFYKISFSRRVYVALTVLTSGVMLVCASKLKFHIIGYTCILLSCVVFVLYY
jgi:drug/metabolite transporter (DMT)-like permease